MKAKKNVLFLGAGRRVEMARLWKQHGWDIFSYENSRTVPIASEAEIIIGKDFMHYVDMLDDIYNVIETKKIDLVVPFFDLACYSISKAEKYLDKMVTSSKETNEICTDKKALENAFKEIDELAKLEVYPTPDAFPLIAKPRFGFGSHGLNLIQSGEQLSDLDKSIDYVFQRFITGDEYTVDCYFDKDSKFVDCVPRKRLRVSGGEVISSITEENLYLGRLAYLIGQSIKFRGAVNMQFIYDETKKEYYLIEINSRFGGGSTLSIFAGMDMIALIERDWLGKKIKYTPNAWSKNILMERSFESFYFGEI